MLEIREKLNWSGLSSFFLFHILSPSLRCWLLSHRCPGSTPVQMDCRPPALLPLARLIISGHCYHHLCSSHWPPAGDAGLFCCSTCGHPAARAPRSTGTLRSLPAPKPTPAGRGEQTSPGKATTSLLSDRRVEEERAENGCGDKGDRHDGGREGKEVRFWGREDEQSYSCDLNPCKHSPSTGRDKTHDKLQHLTVPL